MYVWLPNVCVYKGIVIYCKVVFVIDVELATKSSGKHSKGHYGLVATVEEGSGGLHL